MKQHEYDTNVEQSEMNGTGLLEMHMYSSLGNQRALYYLLVPLILPFFSSHRDIAQEQFNIYGGVLHNL